MYKNLLNLFLKKPSKLIFIHCRNEKNTGDINCTPYIYFKDFFDKYNISFGDLSHIEDMEITKKDIVIFGGGGLFNNNEPWNKNINHLLRLTPHVIGWGVGFNRHYDETQPLENILFNKFHTITCRDYQHPAGLEFLPCVSCMMGQLDNQYPIKRRIGIVQHQHYPINLDFEKTDNKSSLENILEMIGTSEIIITNGYHAMYWATLMGKKVILYKPFSSRFDYFKYPAVVYSGDLETDIKKTKSYPHAKEECRKLTLDFFQKVKDILSAEGKSALQNKN